MITERKLFFSLICLNPLLLDITLVDFSSPESSAGVTGEAVVDFFSPDPSIGVNAKTVINFSSSELSAGSLMLGSGRKAKTIVRLREENNIRRSNLSDSTDTLIMEELPKLPINPLEIMPEEVDYS